MSSAGHVLDMLKRMKANRELLKPKRSRHAMIKAMYQKKVYGKEAPNPLDHLTEAEVIKIRKEIRTKLKVQRNRKVLQLTIAGIILLGLAVWLMWWILAG